MVDFPAWQPVPALLQGRPVHVHNRLIASATSGPALRRTIASEIAQRLGQALGPTCLILPTQGVQAWDKPGQPLHDAAGLDAFVVALQAAMPAHVERHDLPAHINDAAFCEAALAVFDRWVAEGKIPPGHAP
jgi:uncharacterized protein (UPF0261 family)